MLIMYLLHLLLFMNLSGYISPAPSFSCTETVVGWALLLFKLQIAPLSCGSISSSLRLPVFLSLPALVALETRPGRCNSISIEDSTWNVWDLKALFSLWRNHVMTHKYSLLHSYSNCILGFRMLIGFFNTFSTANQQSAQTQPRKQSYLRLLHRSSFLKAFLKSSLKLV